MDVTDSGFADSGGTDQAISSLCDPGQAAGTPPKAAAPVSRCAGEIDPVFQSRRPADLVGVSGGGDSVALLHGLVALVDQERLQLVAAHLNHGIRVPRPRRTPLGRPRSATRLDIPLVLESADVPAYGEQGLNLEEAAREMALPVF